MAAETAVPPDDVVTHPAYIDVVCALVGQVSRTAHAEFHVRELKAERDALALERDRLRRQVAEMRDAGYRVAEQLADEKAEVRRLRELVGEPAAEDDESVDVDTTGTEIDRICADDEPTVLAATRGEPAP